MLCKSGGMWWIYILIPIIISGIVVPIIVVRIIKKRREAAKNIVVPEYSPNRQKFDDLNSVKTVSRLNMQP